MSKRIGIIGGVSPATTIDYYDRITRKYHARCQDIAYPEMVIYSLSHHRFKACEESGQMTEYLAYLLEAVRGLEGAGADFIAMAANSPHRVVDELRQQTRLPIVSAVESALTEARRLGLKKALLLGIRFTMQADFFPASFGKHGIELVVPTLDQQDEIQRIIDQELVFNRILNSSRQWLLDLIASHPVDGVVLACMRLPLILAPGVVPIPVVDTLELHTRDILDFALNAQGNNS